MYRLLILFVLVQLAILARYVVYEAFDPISYGSTYIFLIAAFIIYFVSKSFTKKELQYEPRQISSWSFLNKQSVFTIEKPFYKGKVKRGTIQRRFLKKWHYLIADLLGSKFFLALTIKIDGVQFDIKPTKGKIFSKQDYWTIYKNGEIVGTAKTVVDIKNTVKLKEVIEFQIGENSYYTAAATVTSHISLIHKDEEIGEMKRN
uniref:hypothetical protein n=1 Tax=Neobacillus sp. TaxID=2675273 RepID=UPI0035B52533